MTVRRLVIDDLRTHFDPEAVHARTSAEGLRLLYEGPWDEVWLDHDLGPDDDVMPVVDTMMMRQALEGVSPDVQVFRVHTQNPVGAANILRALARYGFPATRVGVEAFTDAHRR